MLSHLLEFEKRWDVPGMGGFISLYAKGNVSHRISEVFYRTFNHQISFGKRDSSLAEFVLV